VRYPRIHCRANTGFVRALLGNQRIAATVFIHYLGLEAMTGVPYARFLFGNEGPPKGVVDGVR